MPEIIEALYSKYNLEEGLDDRVDGLISDKAAGLYGSFYSIGMILSPLLGSVIYDNFKAIDKKNAFNKTCDVFALITLIYTTIYFGFNVLPSLRKRGQVDKKNCAN